MSGEAREGLRSPWLQAGRLAFLALFGVTLLAALAWAFSNVRQIGPENRAVVLRLGALERLAGPGLLLAWPQPLEQVVLLPSAEQVIERRVEGLLRSEQARRADLDVSLSSDALAGSGYLLTGDAGVVQLDVRVFYKVDDPYAYVLQGAHVLPALDRLVARNAVQVCAARDLDTILVARPELLGNDSAVAERRERLRGDLVQGINHSLAALAAAGSGLGIQVVRVDVQSSLPRNAVSAFNAVLTASQLAEQNVAKARTEAEKLTQAATEGADRTLQARPRRGRRTAGPGAPRHRQHRWPGPGAGRDRCRPALAPVPRTGAGDPRQGRFGRQRRSARRWPPDSARWAAMSRCPTVSFAGCETMDGQANVKRLPCVGINLRYALPPAERGAESNNQANGTGNDGRRYSIHGQRCAAITRQGPAVRAGAVAVRRRGAGAAVAERHAGGLRGQRAVPGHHPEEAQAEPAAQRAHPGAGEEDRQLFGGAVGAHPHGAEPVHRLWPHAPGSRAVSSA